MQLVNRLFKAINPNDTGHRFQHNEALEALFFGPPPDGTPTKKSWPEAGVKDPAKSFREPPSKKSEGATTTQESQQKRHGGEHNVFQLKVGTARRTPTSNSTHTPISSPPLPIPHTQFHAPPASLSLSPPPFSAN